MVGCGALEGGRRAEDGFLSVFRAEMQTTPPDLLVLLLSAVPCAVWQVATASYHRFRVTKNMNRSDFDVKMSYRYDTSSTVS